MLWNNAEVRLDSAEHAQPVPADHSLPASFYLAGKPGVVRGRRPGRQLVPKSPMAPSPMSAVTPIRFRRSVLRTRRGPTDPQLQRQQLLPGGGGAIFRTNERESFGTDHRNVLHAWRCPRGPSPMGPSKALLSDRFERVPFLFQNPRSLPSLTWLRRIHSNAGAARTRTSDRHTELHGAGALPTTTTTDPGASRPMLTASVVIVNYNYGRFLVAIDSALSQTEGPLDTSWSWTMARLMTRSTSSTRTATGSRQC